jgi:hypothetical protein
MDTGPILPLLSSLEPEVRVAPVARALNEFSAELGMMAA